MTKAIALLSGGLDSTLAAKIILEQGVEVEAVNFLTIFCTCTAHGRSCLASKSATDKLGIKLKVFEVTNEYLPIVKKPKYGYGSNMNPCLDCRIFMFRKAGEYMRESGASFLITGEVLGQRPMSQRKEAMRIIERDANLEGLILRPLSAKLMEPTIPEKKGLVDREKLLSIEGRSRKIQMHLADEMGVYDYPCAAGGCLLTDPGFARRMKDLLQHKPDFTVSDVKLIKIGRHFRFSPETAFIVGRNKDENEYLRNLVEEGDFYFYPTKTKGPIGIGKGEFEEQYFHMASGIIARYSDKIQSQQEIEVACQRIPKGRVKFMAVTSIAENRIEALRV